MAVGNYYNIYDSVIIPKEYMWGTTPGTRVLLRYSPNRTTWYQAEVYRYDTNNNAVYIKSSSDSANTRVRIWGYIN